MKLKLFLLGLIWVLTFPLFVFAQPCVYFFYASGCPHCRKVKELIVNLKKKYHFSLKEVDAREDPQTFYSFLKKYQVPPQDWGKVPIVFTAKGYCLGEKDCEKHLEDLIRGETKESPKLSKRSFWLSFSALALTDAVNPCALTIFLLLLLILTSEKKFAGKRIVLPALGFILAVFLSYLLLGVAIVLGFKGASSVSGFPLYRIVGILAVALGVYQLIEFFRSKGGTCKVKPLMGLRLQKLTRLAFSFWGMFVAGLLISLFLLPCSSGPYFVAGGLLAEKSVKEIAFWLPYYNFLFVLPFLILAVGVGLALWEVNKVSGWWQKNSRWFILGGSLVLIGLGIYTLIL